MIRFFRPLLCTALLFSAAPASAAPALWKVSDADSKILLFGSVHILPSDFQWRSERFDQALGKVDKVMFETDVSPAAQAMVAAEAFARGVYTDGTLLTDVLDDAQEARIRAAAAEYSVPFGPLLAMRPWMAAGMISNAAMARAGFTDIGVEGQLLPELTDKTMAYFETNMFQLDLLTGSDDKEDAGELIAALDGMTDFPEQIDSLLDHWVAGQSDGLLELLVEQMATDEDMIDTIIYQRNASWIAPIEKLLADNELTLIVVGAAHLLGDKGVPALLKAKGYTVERIE